MSYNAKMTNPSSSRSWDRPQLLALLALGLVIAGFALLQLNPALDVTLHQPTFHFYIVTFTSFTAAVVAWLVVASVGASAAPRHRMLGLGFAAMGALFFLHGLMTPGALITTFNPGISWSAWLTLLAGGAFFAAGAYLAPGSPDQAWQRKWRRIMAACAGAYLAHAAIVFFTPGWLSAIERFAQPWHTHLLFGLTFTLWLAAGGRLWQTYRRESRRLDGLMALTSALLACASVSMHFFPIWHVSWWGYHVLLLVGFILTMTGLWRTYEQRGSFRLTSYFAAASLIVTVGLALAMGEMFARLSNEDFVRQFETENTTHAANLARGLAREVDALQSPQALRTIAEDDSLRSFLAQELPRLNAVDFTVYDLQAHVVYRADAGLLAGTAVTPEPNDYGDAAYGHGYPTGTTAGGASTQWFSRAAQGETVSEVKPRVAPGGHEAISMLATYIPLPLTHPSAVAILEQPVPDLAARMVTVRARTVLTAAIAMTLLFLLLLVIVRRADRLIQTRTRELEHANASLKRSESLRNDLTHMVVHDLRSPLSAAFANLGLLEKALDRPDLLSHRTRFLTNVRRSNQAMANLIDNLLDVNRMEAGELHLNRQAVDIAGLLQSGAEQVAGLAEQQGKRVAVALPPELPQAVVDRDLIGRVIHNLVQNALKHTDAGGHITLAARAENRHLIVSVQDDGEGIPPEYHTRIFDKFTQINKATRNGSGLGLAFCRLAVEAHGGRIAVASQPDQGSTFSFTLPIE
jgi:signal transduction histidine kinase